MKYLLPLLLLLATPALACEMHMENPEHMAHGQNHAMHEASDNASTTAFKQGMATMHQNMDITYTGDADIDFLKGMIAHHQGAVDMAQTVLQYGRDAQVRRMAKDVIRAQNQEIAWMQTWLAQLEAKGPQVSPNTPRKIQKTDKAWAGSTWLNER